MEVIGATVLRGRRRKFGYLLMHSILYEPGRDELLRTAFQGHGYNVT